MNAISPKTALAPRSHFPLSAATLAAEIVKHHETLNSDADNSPEGKRAYTRRYNHVQAMQDLLLTMQSDDLAGCIAQMIVLSGRFSDDADLETKDDIRDAVEERVDQLQALIFRVLRMLNLDPEALGANTFLTVAALESEGYTPPWARAAEEAAQ